MKAEDWARKNKKKIVNELLRRVKHTSSDEPSGIFMAGLPGAGKTEFTVELLKNIANRPIRIDMDEIARTIEGYKPERADKFRAGASILLSRVYDEVINRHIEFVFDGTFSHGRAIENLERAMHRGYQVKLYYLHQNPVIAWQFTKDREIVEHRAINREGFINTYLSLERNLRILSKTHKDVIISVILKDGDNQVGKRIENVEDIFSLIPKFLTRDDLESVIL